MSKTASTVKKTKTKAKVRDSSLNQCGNPIESQIGVAAEQPMHPSDLQQFLQLERQGSSQIHTPDDQGIRSMFPQSMIINPNMRHPAVGPSSTTPHALPTSRSHHPPASALQLGLSAYPGPSDNYYPPTVPQYTASTPSTSLLSHHSDLPLEFNYAPSSLLPRPELMQPNIPPLLGNSFSGRVGRARVIARTIPYPTERTRPGETTPGERFSISKLPVIRQVRQSTREVTRDLSRTRLPGVVQPTVTGHPDDHTEASGHDPMPGPSRSTGSVSRSPLTPAMISSIRDDARTNFKQSLFAHTLLPTSTQIADFIQTALFTAAVKHLGGNVVAHVLDPFDGVGDWLEKEARNESKKLKDVANNIRNDFKAAARLLSIQCYGLTLPIDVRSQEVAFRQGRVSSLLADFSYLDGVRTINGVDVVVPFGHPAVVQLVLQLLWKDNGYSRYLPNDMNIDAVIAFAGTIVHWVLQENASVVVTQIEFNLREHLPTHTQHVQRIEGLQGNELDMYKALVDDLRVRGAEMRGLIKLINCGNATIPLLGTRFTDQLYGAPFWCQNGALNLQMLRTMTQPRATIPWLLEATAKKIMTAAHQFKLEARHSHSSSSNDSCKHRDDAARGPQQPYYAVLTATTRIRG
ncbi:hypothetical protein BU15DRAFT_64846 [Melanogaster broomeanus]|nr:hypothetical protein BU15DRAFT_64846 [Melanogaster broomeanus]